MSNDWISQLRLVKTSCPACSGMARPFMCNCRETIEFILRAHRAEVMEVLAKKPTKRRGR